MPINPRTGKPIILVGGKTGKDDIFKQNPTYPDVFEKNPATPATPAEPTLAPPPSEPAPPPVTQPTPETTTPTGSPPPVAKQPPTRKPTKPPGPTGPTGAAPQPALSPVLPRVAKPAPIPTSAPSSGLSLPEAEPLPPPIAPRARDPLLGDWSIPWQEGMPDRYGWYRRYDRQGS